MHCGLQAWPSDLDGYDDGAGDEVDRAQSTVRASGVQGDGVCPVCSIYALVVGVSSPARTHVLTAVLLQRGLHLTTNFTGPEVIGHCSLRLLELYRVCEARRGTLAT